MAQKPVSLFELGDELSPNFDIFIEGKDTSSASSVFEPIRPLISSVSYEEDEDMTVAFAQRTDGLRLEGAYQVLARAQELEAQGRQIVHLEIGEHDFPTPENIGRAAARAIAEGKTHYNPSAGIRELRAAIAADASQRRGLAILPEQVVVSPGAKPNLFFPALALVNPGEEVVYPDPGFPTYEAMIRVTGGVGRPVPLLESNGFSIDRDVLARLMNARTRLIILNSPANPTGGIVSAEQVAQGAEIALARGVPVLSDHRHFRA